MIYEGDYVLLLSLEFPLKSFVPFVPFCGLSPDLREHALKVAAQNSFDIGIAVLAADQSLGQIKHAFRMVEALDIDLLAEAVTSLVTRAELLVELRRHRVVAV